MQSHIQTVNLTIEAWAKFGTENFHIANIDVFAHSINSLTNNKQQIVNESGENGIGFLSFSYQIQLMNNSCTHNCGFSIPAHNTMDHQVTPSPAAAGTSFTPTDNGIYQQTSSSPTEEIFSPADDSANQQIHEPCSPPWAWIAVTILFMLLTILLFIVSIALICINRNMTKKQKEIKIRCPIENNGE